MTARARILVAISILIAGLLLLAIGWPFSSQSGSLSDGMSLTAIDKGGRRQEVLRHLTEVYVTHGANVSPGMRSGVELAPASFLNAELERQGAKWRVGNVHGSEVEFFDIFQDLRTDGSAEMTTLVQMERSRAENRFPAHQRSLDWEERWGNYASVLGDERPVMAYVRDRETQRISPICRNLLR